MNSINKVPSLKKVLSSLIFGAGESLSIRDMRKCLKDVAESDKESGAVFAEVKDGDIKRALAELASDLVEKELGFELKEVAGGFRYQSDATSGIWLKSLLNAGKKKKMSRPALETLAIIAYRQPIGKSDIEAVRGVDVGHMIKSLMEMQLVKITGRSDLPGRPFLYGTTSLFLEHFGLKNLKELAEMEPMLLAKKMSEKSEAEAEKAVQEAVEAEESESDEKPADAEEHDPEAPVQEDFDDDDDDDEYDDDDDDDD